MGKEFVRIIKKQKNELRPPLKHTQKQGKKVKKRGKTEKLTKTQAYIVSISYICKIKDIYRFTEAEKIERTASQKRPPPF